MKKCLNFIAKWLLVLSVLAAGCVIVLIGYMVYMWHVFTKHKKQVTIPARLPAKYLVACERLQAGQYKIQIKENKKYVK